MPPAEAAVDLYAAVKCEVSLGRHSSALQRQRRLGAELADGRQVIFAEAVVDVLVAAEAVVDVLVAAEWSPYPGTR